MIRLLLISALLFQLVSCKPYQVQNSVVKQTSIKEFKNPYFDNPEIDYVYKAQIEVYGNKLGGIFVAKKISDSVHRVVFTTEFGNKLMDFELSDNEFKVNYIIEQLDKKIILNTLKEDFRLLLKVHHQINQSFENDLFNVYKSNNDKRFIYFFINRNDNKLIKLISASKYKEKVVFEFESKNTTFAEMIRINHKNIKLKIELNQIIN
ncbi:MULTISPECIES: hypothetical protein [Flavobacterium]|uniref:Lipoprotein n=1 Tax=Flavobacterium hankyongi TaxID=1176532 RepID=A0ABP9A6W8_9FLAO|nr:hypothetical protein [Flavobacterium sp. N1846]